MAVSAEFSLNTTGALNALEAVITKFNVLEGVGTRMEHALKQNFNILGQASKSLSTDISGVAREMNDLVKKSERAERAMKGAFNGASTAASRTASKTSAVNYSGGGSGRRSGGLLSAVSSVPILGSVVAITAAGASATAGAGIRAAADREMYQERFRTLLGRDMGDQAYSATKSYADKTSFGMDELSPAMGTLLGYFQDFEKSMEALRMVGDIASVSGGDVQELAAVFGKSVNNGVDMEAINQIAERGIDVLGYFAERDGISRQDVRKAVERKEYGGEDITELFMALTTAGGAYYQGALKQSETFWGKISTFMDELNTRLADKMAPYLGKITDAISMMFDMLDRAEPELQEFGEIIITAAQGFMGILESLAPVFLGLWEILKSLLSVFANLLTLMDGALEPLLQLVALLAYMVTLGAAAVLMALGDAMGWLAKQAVDFLKWLGLAKESQGQWKAPNSRYDEVAAARARELDKLKAGRGSRLEARQADADQRARFDSALSGARGALKSGQLGVKDLRASARESAEKRAERMRTMAEVEKINRDYKAKTTLSDSDYKLYLLNEQMKVRQAELMRGGFTEDEARKQAFAEASRAGEAEKKPEYQKLIAGNNRGNAIRGIGSELGRSSTRLLGGNVDDVQKKQLTQQQNIARSTALTAERLQNFQATAPAGLV